MTEDKRMLQKHVDSIAKGLIEGLTYDECGLYQDCDDVKGSDCINGFDYLQDALDIQYIVRADGEYIGARILVSFGGPNIWIDTARQMVDGYWWSDSYSTSYHNDEMGIHEACRDLWEVNK